MKKNDKIGTTIIDELKICYDVAPEMLREMRTVEMGAWTAIGKLNMVRFADRHFLYSFEVFSFEAELLGYIFFDQYSDRNFEHIWLRICNELLYSPMEKIEGALRSIEASLGLTFHNLTTLDLAQDHTFNIVSRIRRLFTCPKITTILNGKAICDRKQVLPGLHIAYDVSLDKMMHPTFWAKQKKAIKDKTKGICVVCYNKRAEIDFSSNKTYILNYYGFPRHLHRIEVHLNRRDIADYCNKMGIDVSPQIIFDKAILDALFYQGLQAVIRFSDGKKKIEWNSILSGSQDTITTTPGNNRKRKIIN